MHEKEQLKRGCHCQYRILFLALVCCDRVSIYTEASLLLPPRPSIMFLIESSEFARSRSIVSSLLPICFAKPWLTLGFGSNKSILELICYARRNSAIRVTRHASSFTRAIWTMTSSTRSIRSRICSVESVRCEAW